MLFELFGNRRQIEMGSDTVYAMLNNLFISSNDLAKLERQPKITWSRQNHVSNRSQIGISDGYENGLQKIDTSGAR